MSFHVLSLCHASLSTSVDLENSYGSSSFIPSITASWKPLTTSALAYFWHNMYCPELKLLAPLSGLELLSGRLGLTHTASPKPNTVLGSDEHLGNVSVG